jgi:hypothetical protein
MLRCLLLLQLLVPLSLMAAPPLPTREHPLLLDGPGRRVLLYTEVNGRNLTTTNPHWGIVAIGGTLADKAILRSYADPLSLHDALVKLGARPGNNLTAGSSGQYVAGELLEVTVSWPGLGRELPLSAVFEDEAGKGFRIRFGGNRAAARHEHTGCITCLESCWVAVTSNDRYPFISTLKRLVSPNSRFRGKGAVLPADGGAVIVSYRLVRDDRRAGTAVR